MFISSKKSIYCLMMFMYLAMVCSCSQPPEPPAAQVKTMGTISVKGGVHEMTLNPANTVFPEHPGKKEFTAYCGICHSLKYISMQPDFPRKTWEAEVHKMVEKYGAPIDSVTSLKIVDYLLAVKGDGK